MPRIKTGFNVFKRPGAGKLLERLVDELKSDRESGQPFIYEQEFSTGKIRVLVVWDEWKHLPLEDRTSTVLSAYEVAEGKEYRARIALASGLTVPEAVAAGMLPYRIIPAWRKRDPVTQEQCHQAMLEEGASTLLGSHLLLLCFPTQQAAEACKLRLAKRLPESDDVWIITQELPVATGAQEEDFASGEVG